MSRCTIALTVASWLGLCALALVVIAAAGGHARITYVVAVVAAALIARLALRRLADVVAVTTWPRQQQQRARTQDEGRAADSRTTVIESSLRRSVDDPHAFAHRVQPTLRTLADHGLRRHHGVDPSTSPDAARALLGDDTWALLYGSPPDRPSTRQLAAAVASIEGLA